MAILYLQLQWNWVWVLHMGSSYYVMTFQMEVWKRNFQQESTTEGRCMNASIITFRVILVAHI